MAWRKLGRVYTPKTSLWWATNGYAHLPTVERLNDEVFRVFFASLDQNNFGRIGYVDLAVDNPLNVLAEANEPILDIGTLGAFDDCGVVPSCLLRRGGQTYLYYVGFQRCERVPYMLFTGLAIAPHGSTQFSRHALTPILDRTPNEPYSRSAPYILTDGPVLKMWYWSSIDWTERSGTMHYNNVIRYATSMDGISWKTHPHICIEPDFAVEYAIGRPSICRDGDRYQMWYAVRRHEVPTYIIGYAESADGINWQRDDARAGIDVSADGWDSEMVCYPQVIGAGAKKYLFYNGNQHGKTGFGVAVFDE